MPTFAVGAAATYSNADEGWGIPVTDPLNGNQELSWHLIDRLIQDEFDIVSCQEMLVDHAFTIPLKLLWPDKCPVTVVPICINTVQFPLPSAKRVFALGQAVGRAIRGWDASKNVVILGTGGLSHQLDGARAGFINKKFDLEFMDSLLNEPQWATRFSIEELVEQSGTQGVELLMWLAMRGALGDAKEFKIHKVHENYHIPISNTATGLIAFECA
jgi:protocatechuate 4,5-dioxygenase beta chain